MNSIFESRNAYSITPTPRHELPKHMVCPNCENTWKGYVIHTTDCPTPTWVYDSRNVR
jgi:hypothetical protein